jgi:hypothetical protein
MEDGEEGIAPVAKAVLSTIEAWDQVFREHSNNQANVAEDVLKGTLTVITELTRKYVVSREGSSKASFFDIFPPSLKPIVKVVVEKYSKERWDVVVDLVAQILKEYGKDKRTGNYRSTEEVLKDSITRLFEDKLLDYIFTH